MNNRLHDRRYLAGDDYSIADIICYPWAVTWTYQGQSPDEFPHVKRWADELAALERPARHGQTGTDMERIRRRFPPTASASREGYSPINARPAPGS